MTQIINRKLPDRMMDHIDHALGRPGNPLGETYRDYFAVGIDTDLDREMAASPFWRQHKSAADDQLRAYRVTFEGRCALAQYLRKRNLQPKAFTVTFDGFSSTVWAMTRSKARYDKWLEVADCCPDLRFGDFVKRARVCAA